MAQYPKTDVKQRILDSALWHFSQSGFQGSTLASIARKAGISIGNLYRYYPSKEHLYQDLIPDSFVRRLTTLLHQRVDSLKGVEDVALLAPGAPFHLFTGQLLDYCVQYRLQVATLILGSQGTANQEYGNQLISDLCNRSIQHFRELRPGLRISHAHRFVLQQIYRGFVLSSARLLVEFDSGPALREAIRRYAAYHLSGLKALFEVTPDKE